MCCVFLFAAARYAGYAASLPELRAHVASRTVSALVAIDLADATLEEVAQDRGSDRCKICRNAHEERRRGMALSFRESVRFHVTCRY